MFFHINQLHTKIISTVLGNKIAIEIKTDGVAVRISREPG